MYSKFFSHLFNTFSADHGTIFVIFIEREKKGKADLNDKYGNIDNMEYHDY